MARGTHLCPVSHTYGSVSSALATIVWSWRASYTSVASCREAAPEEGLTWGGGVSAGQVEITIGAE